MGVFVQGCNSNDKNSEAEAEMSYNDEEEPNPEPAASYDTNDEEENREGGYSQDRRAMRVSCEVAESQSESPTKNQNYTVDYSKNLPVGRKLEKKARICIESSNITQCRKFTDSLSSRYGAYVEKEHYTILHKAASPFHRLGFVLVQHAWNKWNHHGEERVGE